MATDEVPFRAADLIGPAGSGSNGEKLVNTLVDYYPPELQAAQLKRINAVLDAKLGDDELNKIAKLVGVSQIEQANVRGGERRAADAVITYAWLDDDGVVWKGCFPYNDLGAGKMSDGHVSQRDSMANSATAQAYRQENPQPRRQAEAQPAGESDPFALSEMSASELTALMDEHPDRADAIKAFERAFRGDKARKSVLEHGESSGDDDSGDSGESAPSGPTGPTISQ